MYENTENKINNSDEIVDKEEYERALEVLNKSKSARVKKINDTKKEKKRKEKEESKKESSEASAKGKNGFWDKCKKDPVIPVCIVLLIAAVVFIAVRFIAPLFGTKTLNITVDRLRADYLSTQIYNDYLSDYNFAIPEVIYYDTNNEIALTASAENKKSSDVIYFNTNIPNTGTSFSTGIQGSAKKSDGEIIALRVVCEYPASVDATSYYQFLVTFFGSYMQTLFPDVSLQDASTLAMDAITNINGENYIVRGDIAYRVSLVTTDTINYVTLDFLPADNV